MTNKLFVGSFDYTVTDTQLEEHFATNGKVISAKVAIDSYTGQGKGFGFVEMENAQVAKTAMNNLNGSQIAGRAISIKEAKPQTAR